MKYWMAALLLLCLLASGVRAQKLELHLDALAAKATEKTEINLDGATLAQALESQAAKKSGFLNGVKAFSLRSYEFAKEGEYSDRDLEPLRKQAGDGSGWSRMLSVKEKDESIEIYILHRGDQMGGFLLIAAEPKELTVIYADGEVQLAQIQELVHSNIQYDLARLGESQAKK